MLFNVFIFLSLLLGHGVNSRIIPISFIIFPLMLLSGLQLDVGTDYQSYLLRAETGNAHTFTRKYEYGFAIIIWLSNKLNYPQSIFLLSSFLQYTFLLIFCGRYLKYFNLRSGIIHILLIFILLFYANIAANQLNLLRFYIALPIFGLFLLELKKDRKFYRICLLIALTSSFHLSFLFLSFLAIGLYFCQITWRGAIALGVATCFLWRFILNYLSEIYHPLSRIDINVGIEMNIGPTDLPLIFTYLIITLMHSKEPTMFRPFVVLHFIMMLFIFGPEAVSERLSYVVYFLTVSLSLVVFRRGTPRIASQTQIAIYAVWFLLPAYKFLIFNDREYGFQWIL